MKKIKYLCQFLIIFILLKFFKFIGYKLSSDIGATIFKLLGPLFRSKKVINENLNKLIKFNSSVNIKELKKSVWGNYGRIFAEYSYLQDFRNRKLDNYIRLEGKEVLNNIKKSKKPVIFISGHFSNFELLAMHIEMSGISLATLYRPLNNQYLDKVMVDLRKKNICRHQVKKGLPGVKSMLNHFRKGTSIALMIDQRVSEGDKIKFFNHYAYTTTIPSQFVKKFNCQIVPVFIKRVDNHYFNIKFEKPLQFSNKDTNEFITQKLNHWLEEKILEDPYQWIWTHDRWK